jgi:hypothetical protein
MPSRRRPKSSPSPTPASSSGAAASPTKGDPAELFAAALRESEARDKATRERQRQQQDAAAARAAEQAAHADALQRAHRDLERAIQAVRDAKHHGRSTVQADAEWKSAKARVIELETGAPPTWAPPPVVAPDVGDGEVSDGDVSDGEESSPLDDGAVGEQ